MAKLYITSDSVWRERGLPAWTASLLAWEGAALGEGLGQDCRDPLGGCRVGEGESEEPDGRT